MDRFLFFLSNFEIAAGGILHICFSEHFTKKKAKLQHYALYLLLLAAIETVASLLKSGQLSVIWEMLALYAISRLTMKNNRFDSGITAILAVYLTQLSFGIVNSLESLLFPMMPKQTASLCLLLVLVTLTALMLCICCYKLILKWFPLTEDFREPSGWLLLLPSLFLFAAELYISMTAYGHTPAHPERGKQLALLGLQALSLGTMLSALYAYQCICRSFRTQATLTCLAQETQAQKTYVAEAQMRYAQTTSFRHDIKNHLSVLDGLLKTGQIIQAEDYLRKLKAAANALSFPCHTGNPVIDILLGEKLEFAKSHKIRTELELSLPQPCNVDDLDLCIIFANALDNALRACLNIQGETCIRIFGKQQGDFYMLSFENTCLCRQTPKLGTGLSNIKAVAEKYHGAMEMDVFGLVFRLHVLLIIT